MNTQITHIHRDAHGHEERGEEVPAPTHSPTLQKGVQETWVIKASASSLLTEALLLKEACEQ